MKEVEARAEYAKWFVRSYYLQKRYLDYSFADKVRTCEERGYIRYKKVFHPDLDLGEGRTFTYDELDHHLSSYVYVSERFKPQESWWQVPWSELDDPINDDNEIVQRYRLYRRYAEENRLLAWLQAEAEFKKITAEAWLRSYGVDIQAP